MSFSCSLCHAYELPCMFWWCLIIELLNWSTVSCQCLFSWLGLLYFMMTSSNGKFSALLAICAGNSPVTGEFPAQRSVTRSFDVFFDLRLNKRFSKQRRSWWFETPSRPLWRHCNVLFVDSPFSNIDWIKIGHGQVMTSIIICGM